MRERIKMFQILLGLVTSLFGLSSRAQCPDSKLGETAQDCPWAQVTRDTTSLTSFHQIRQTIEREIPGFVEQLEQDAESRHLLNLWGLSRNIDESNLAKGLKTIPANLIQFFNSILKVPYDQESIFGHAGLNHTYGYLFSNMKTPFGYKRARYVKGELEAGFGLAEGRLSGMPNEEEGTLLSNLTYFAGKIAFRQDPETLSRLQRYLDHEEFSVAKEIEDYDYRSLKVKRLVEIAQPNPDFSLTLRTDIVEFPLPNGKGSDTALLIYSIDYHRTSEHSDPRLITAFPVARSFADGLFTASRLGDSVSLKLNYNAALPVTIPEAQMVGKRFIGDESKH